MATPRKAANRRMNPNAMKRLKSKAKAVKRARSRARRSY